MPAQIENISDQRTLDVFNNVSFGNPALQIKAATDDDNLKTTAAVAYRINGQAHTLAATATIALTAATVALNGFTIQPNGSTYYYLITVNAAGTPIVTPPPAARTGNPDTTGLLLAAMPADSCVIGIMKLTATAAFTPASSKIAAQGTFAAINSYPADGDPTAFTYASVSA